MQTDNKFLDDMARMMSSAMGTAGSVKDEMEARTRQHMESFFARMDFVRREEFEVVRDMAALARQDNERLAAKVAELEAKLAKADKPAPAKKKAAAKKPAVSKAAPKKAAAKKPAAKKSAG
jgi:BMFP domain-containing protein YqiC